MPHPILISSDKLQLLLRTHENEIGLRKHGMDDQIIAGIAYLLTVGFCHFNSPYNQAIKTVLIVIGFAYLARALWLLFKARRKQFTPEKLFEEIDEANEMERTNHSIIVVRDTFRPHSNKYLVYYDPRWDCKLFLNYHTTPSIDENIANINRHLSMDFKVDESNVQGTWWFHELHEKYSESHKKNRLYDHNFYEFKFKIFPEQMEADEFEIDGRHYYWMSMAEMEQDNRIIAVNADILSMIKKNS